MELSGVLQQRKQETLVSAGDADHCGTQRQIGHDPETTNGSWQTTRAHKQDGGQLNRKGLSY